MNKGWISLHRKLEEHWLFPKDRAFTEFEAWIDLLMQVNHVDKKVFIKGKLLECKRGESVRSIKEWAKRWGWNKSKVYRFFNVLKSDDMIETDSETVTTRLSICNYDKWQDSGNGNETQMKHARNAHETQADTNNNVNNINNDNKGESKIPELSEVVEYFVQNGYSSEAGKKAFDYYQASIEGTRRKMWRDSKGNPIKNWKQKMRSVWFKEENKPTFTPHYYKRL